MLIDDLDVGGGVVSRRFTLGGEVLLAGTELTREQLLAMPRSNRRALIENRFLRVWPASVGAGGQRFAIHRGGGAYDVIEGRLLNTEPLTKAQAEALAAPKPNAAAA